MSATPEVFKAYVMRVLDGDLGAVANVMANYEGSLRETATYHKYFIDLRDGKGGWSEKMADLRWQLQEERAHNARLLDELAAERAKWKPGGPAGSIRDTRPATFGH